MTPATIPFHQRLLSWAQVGAVAIIACHETMILFSTVKQAIGWFRPDDMQKVVTDFTADEVNALNGLKTLSNGKVIDWIVVDGTGNFSIPYPVNAAVYGTPKIVMPRRMLNTNQALASFWVHHAIIKIEINSYFWSRTVGLVTFVAAAIFFSKTYPFWMMCWFAYSVQNASSGVFRAISEIVASGRTLKRTNDAMKTEAHHFLQQFEEEIKNLVTNDSQFQVDRHKRYEPEWSLKIYDLQKNLAYQG